MMGDETEISETAEPGIESAGPPGTLGTGTEVPGRADSGRNGAELPPVDEALTWAGAKLDEMSGSSIGRVEGIYVDADSAEPRWLLVRMGRFGHHSALPYSHAVAGVGRIWAPYDRDTVRQAPRVDAGEPFTRELELQLCRFYGIGESAGRGAEISGRPEGTPTARPAQPDG